MYQLWYLVSAPSDVFRTESLVLKDKPTEQGPFAHCGDDDKEVVITDEGKRLSDAKTS